MTSHIDHYTEAVMRRIADGETLDITNPRIRKTLHHLERSRLAVHIVGPQWQLTDHAKAFLSRHSTPGQQVATMEEQQVMQG